MRRLFCLILGGVVLTGGTVVAEVSVQAYCRFTEVTANKLYWT